MAVEDPLLAQLHEARRNFLALVSEIRPELHRYCARMTGSIVDGEDVVQETLARAYYELAELREMPALRGWLFRIAHNRALDLLRQYDRRMNEPLDAAEQAEEAVSGAAEEALIQEQAIHTALSQFLELAPAQRSCVILKDVLGHSLEEIGQLLSMSIPAVKAALYRGRSRLMTLSVSSDPPQPRQSSPVLARYVELFNARDWEGVRAMLSEDVRLDLISATHREGRRQVGNYFANYDKLSDWRLVLGWLNGREVLAVLRPAHAARPSWYVEVLTTEVSIVRIRDYYHVPYITQEADFQPAGPTPG